MFVSGVPGFNKCLEIFSSLLNDQCPELAKHLAEQGIEAHMYTQVTALVLLVANLVFAAVVFVAVLVSNVAR